MVDSVDNGERLELSPRIRYRAIDDEGVVVHVDRGEVMVLNAVALRTLQLIGETGSRSAVLGRLVQEYDAPEAVLAADLDSFLGELREHDLLRTTQDGY